MTYKGALNKHENALLSGWCINTDDPEEIVSVDICWEEFTLRRIAASSPNGWIEKRHGNAVSSFYFAVHQSVRDLLPHDARLQVKAPDGQLLALQADAEALPIGLAEDGGVALRKKFADGYFVDKWGAFKLPFRAMSAEKRASYATALDRTAAYFKQRFGVTLFPHYGTLLGYARSGSFLPHDDDTDTSHIIESGDLATVARTFLDIAEACHDDGLMVRMVAAGQYSVTFPDCGNIGTDIFCSWHNLETGDFSTYFGVHGKLAQPVTFFEAELESARIHVPQQFKDILALTYGENWLVPDPYFSWNRHIGALAGVMQGLRDAAGSRVEELSKKTLTRFKPEPDSGKIN